MCVVNLKLYNFILSFHKTKSHSTDQISGNVELDNLNSSFKPLNIPSCHLAGSRGKKLAISFWFFCFLLRYIGYVFKLPFPQLFCAILLLC